MAWPPASAQGASGTQPETVQQAMVKIFSHLAQLTESDKFKQWAMRVIENEAKMYRRKRRQHLYESLDQSSTEASEDKPFYPKQFADWRSSEMRQKIERHLRGCRRCSAVYDSTRKMLVITGDERVFELPTGFSERLHGFLNEALSKSDTH
jgi:hypothetical protein